MSSATPWRRWAARLVAVMLGALVGIAVLQLLDTQEPGSMSSSWVGEIEIDTTSRIEAGSAVTAVVRADAPDGTPATAAVFGVLDTHVQYTTMVGGRADFLISPSQTDHAGRIDLVVDVGGARATSHIMSTPREAADPVVPLVGPRTIIANGDDFTMVVTSAVDRFGNPVANGTEVVTRARRPDGTVDGFTSRVLGGVAATIVRSDTEVGRVTITSEVGDARGPANVVDQVAGIPAPFGIDVDRRNAIADGFALHEMTTEQLFDTFGNELPDGVSATFVIDSPTGRSFVDSTVQGGVATGLLEAPSEPGDVTVTARVSGRESAATTLTFVSGVVELPVDAVAGPGDVVVSVGRVLASRGGYPPDGTGVEVVDPRTGEVIAVGALREGEVSITAPTSSFGTEVEVRVLGYSVITRIGTS